MKHDHLFQKLPNISDTCETLWWPLYDFNTFNFPIVGGESISFFQMPVGTGDPPKTYEDTNMTLHAMLPQGNRFLVVGFQVEVQPAFDSPMTIEEVEKLRHHVLQHGVLEFTIRNKLFLIHGPLSHFHFGFPTWKVPSYITRLYHAFARILEKFGIEIHTLKPTMFEITPTHINAQESFRVRISFDERCCPGVPVRIGVFMEGYLIRDAQ